MYRISILLALSLLACRTEENGRYCDATTPCATAAYPYCDLDKNECEATAPPQMDAAVSPDLSAVVDLATPDLTLVVDAAIVDEAASPDLTPVGCTAAADCTQAAAPICDSTSSSCRACNAAADDAECAAHSAFTPHCRLGKSGGPSVGQCVLCNSSSDCTSTMSPICDATGVCRGCQLHSECPSGVCIIDTGHCADSNDVAYIDNTGHTISECRGNGALHDGAPTHPYCEILDGIMAGKPFEKVTGHLGFPYPPLAFNNSGSFTIIGPGAGVANPATITNGNDSDVAVSMGAGETLTLILDGLELGDRGNNSNNAALFCTTSGGGTANLTLRNSVAQRANNTGISSSNCALTVTSSAIRNNGNSGVSISGGSATLTGNTITANSTSGFSCSSNATATLTGNTITSNTGPGINNSACTLTATGNTITGNSGDGIDCGAHTTLKGNTIGKNAKGVSCDNTTVSLDSNQIFGATGAGAPGVELKNASSYTIINNFIYGNLGPGVKLSMNATGKFIFNTVVENGNGVDCGGGGVKPLEASIVWGNQSGGSTQFPSSSCSLLQVVTGTDSFSGAIQQTPEFVTPSPSPGPIDFHLKTPSAANSACCLDKIGGQLDGGSPLPDHDIDGETRPRGVGYDVGADEAQ